MQPRHARREWGWAIALGALLFLLAPWLMAPVSDPAVAASGVRLIMVDDPACYYCRKWNAEIGRGYGKSAEGRFAPLKRVRRGAKEIQGFAPVVFTPTFIVVRGGSELGRISGYPGRDYFYSELGSTLRAAGFAPRG
jgi:hypothetical protein